MDIKKYKLTDICAFQGGSQPPKKEWSTSKKEGYVRMLQIRDFTQSHKNNVEYVKDTKRLKKCNADDVLIGRYGASVGKILTGLDGAYNVAIMKTIPDKRVLTKKYLLALLKAPSFQNFILNVGARAAQAGFNKDDLSKFYVYLPSIDNQRRIAKVLSDCETLIQKRKDSIELLDEYLKSTFLEMFGPKNENYQSWQIDKIESYAKKRKGSMRTGPFGSDLLHSEFTDEGDVCVIGIDNVVNNAFEWGKPRYITFEKYETLKRYQIFPEDVLISIMATNGKSAVVPKNIPISINSKHLAAITLDQSAVLPYYLKYSFEYHPDILQQLSKNMKGAIMSGLNLTIIKNLKLPKPPIGLQEDFTRIVEKYKSIKTNFKNSLVEIENLYGSLSQKAFKGELDLSKVDISLLEESFKPESTLEENKNQLTVEPITIEKLEQIIKSSFEHQEFSVAQIEEVLSKQGVDFNTSLVKGFIKDLLSEAKIRTEYSGSTHQVIFKYNI